MPSLELSPINIFWFLSSVLQFSIHRSYIFLVRVIPKYFIFGGIILCFQFHIAISYCWHVGKCLTFMFSLHSSTFLLLLITKNLNGWLNWVYSLSEIFVLHSQLYYKLFKYRCCGSYICIPTSITAITKLPSSNPKKNSCINFTLNE